MKTIKVKVLVDKDITACAQMRSRRKDSEWSDFLCGVDLAGHLLVANCPQVWGRSFLDLVETVIAGEQNSCRPVLYELQDPEELEYVMLCDDSQALVSIPSYEEDDSYYYEELDRVKEEQRKEISKYLERLLRHMVLNEEGYWEGYVEINCR